MSYVEVRPAFSILAMARHSRGGGMADAPDLKSGTGNSVWVRLPPSAPIVYSNVMSFIIALLSKLPVPLLLLIGTLLNNTGDYTAKYWSVTNKHLFFFIGFIAYSLAGLFYMPTLLKRGLVVTSVMWSALGMVGYLLIGLVIFKERLSPIQIFGVVLGISSFLILSFAGE